MTQQEKQEIVRDLVASLSQECEVRRIVVFGSFLHSSSPHDLDVAIFQDSAEPYLPLAMKYRGRTRHIARRIPLDIVPIRPDARPSTFLSEIRAGEVVYER